MSNPRERKYLGPRASERGNGDTCPDHLPVCGARSRILGPERVPATVSDCKQPAAPEWPAPGVCDATTGGFPVANPCPM